MSFWVIAVLAAALTRLARGYGDVVLFFAGLLIALWETFFEHVDRPALLLLAGTMMGLGGLLRANGK